MNCQIHPVVEIVAFLVCHPQRGISFGHGGTPAGVAYRQVTAEPGADNISAADPQTVIPEPIARPESEIGAIIEDGQFTL